MPIQPFSLFIAGRIDGDVESVSTIAHGQSAARYALPRNHREQPSMMLQDTPLTEDEIDELDQYLLYGTESDEAMVIDVLDGYLHAIAIAPITLHPRQWLPKIWGTDQMMPSGESLDRVNHILGLVFRHYNSIIANLESNPPELYTTWATTLYRGKEYDDAEGWAYGFIEGMRLCWNDWQPLLSTKEGQAWFRPIGLLAEHDFSPDQDELTKTPARRAKLALQIPDAIVAMHSFWIPQRLAAAQEIIAKASAPKVGRNDPCPCGSRQKFKKCCGRGPSLH